MVETLSQQELEKYLWDAAILLRGYIDASDYKQFIFPLLFLKRICDVYDEEYREALQEYGDEAAATFPESHRFQIPVGVHWHDVRAVSENVGKAIQSAMREIEKANPKHLAAFLAMPLGRIRTACQTRPYATWSNIFQQRRFHSRLSRKMNLDKGTST